MSIIKEVASHPLLQETPPVLIDIGASGSIHSKWKQIAPYSICIAFDADDRKFETTIENNKGYKKLITINSIVTDGNYSKIPFYLTASPYCSSTLVPDLNAVSHYSFADKFSVTKQTELNCITLTAVLEQLKIGYIDWFKTDSQGTDLQLFKSLSPTIINNIKIAEFEPGIMDAYLNEDKLFEILHYMNTQPFYLAEAVVKGVPRISVKQLESITTNVILKKIYAETLMPAACWGELTFFNTHAQVQQILRNYLVGWLFAIINKQYGLALTIIELAKKEFDESLFDKMQLYTKRKIKYSIFSFRFFKQFFKKITS